MAALVSGLRNDNSPAEKYTISRYASYLSRRPIFARLLIALSSSFGLPVVLIILASLSLA